MNKITKFLFVITPLLFFLTPLFLEVSAQGSCIVSLGANQTDVATNPATVILQYDSQNCANLYLSDNGGTPVLLNRTAGSVNRTVSFTSPYVPYDDTVSYYLYGEDCTNCGFKSISPVTINWSLARVTVTENGASGGSWVLSNTSPGNSTTNTINVADGVTAQTCIGNIVPPNGFNVNRVVNTSGGGNCLFVHQPGQVFGFTIYYDPIPPPLKPIVDLQVSPAGANNFSNGPITVAARSNVDLRWTLSGGVATGCTASNDWSGSKTPTGGTETTGQLLSTVTFTIMCSNAAGDSNYDSVTVNVAPIVGGGGPNPPTNVTAVEQSCGVVWVSWTPSTTSGVTNYTVYRSTTSGGPYTSLGSVGSSASGFQDTTGATGATYYYVVQAVHPTSGNSGNSNQASVTVSSSPCGGGGAPTTPTGLSVSTSPTCGGNIIVSWNSVSGATSYDLMRNGSTQLLTVTSPYTNSGLTPGTSYSYQVRANNSNGPSSWSSASSATASAACAAGGPVSVNISASQNLVNAGQTVTLTWSSTNATSCIVPSSAPNNGVPNWMPNQTKNLTGTNYPVGGPLNNVGVNRFIIRCSNTMNTTDAFVDVTVSGGTALINVNSNVNVGAQGVSPNYPWYVLDIGGTIGSGSVSPSNWGYGTFTAHTVYPTLTGTNYSINPSTGIPGYGTPTITPTSIVNLIPGRSIDVFINYPPATPPFTYTLSATNVSIQRGSSGQSTVAKTLTSAAGSGRDVDLVASGLPTGVTPSYSNQPCTPTCNGYVNMTVSGSAVAGTYPITVTGIPNNVTTSFNLTITNPAATTLSCVANPTSVFVNQNTTWTASITGGAAPFTYEWSFDGAPFVSGSASMIKQYATTGQKTANARVTDSLGTVTLCSTSGGIGTLNVSVNPDFKQF